MSFVFFVECSFFWRDLDEERNLLRTFLALKCCALKSRIATKQEEKDANKNKHQNAKDYQENGNAL